MASLMPVAKQQYFKPGTTIPLAGGKLYTYEAGTNTPKVTYQDAAGTIPQTNPITLDSTGSALVYWDGNYKIVLKDIFGNTIYTVDNYNNDFVGFKSFVANLLTAIGSTLVGFIQAGAGAIKRTVQDELRETFKVTQFGAVGNGIADDTAAFEAVLAAHGGKRIYIPPGTYRITRSLTIPGGTEFFGDGPSSAIVQYTDNIPILYAQSERTKIHSLQLKYNTYQAGKPWANAIHVQLLYESIIDRLYIINAYNGIYCKRYTTSDADTSGNYIYSCEITNLRISEYANTGMYLSTVNQGNSGNVLRNIYVLNRDGAGFHTTGSGVIIENTDDGIIEQLNIEHAVHTGPSLVINTCGNLTINGLHFEGIRCATDYIGLFDVLNSKVTLTGMTACFNFFTAPVLYALFRLGGGSIMTSNIVERDNTATSPNRPVFYSVNGTCAARHLGQNLLQKFTTWHSGLTQTPPVLLEADYTSQYVDVQYVGTRQNVGWNNNGTYAQSINSNANAITEWRRFQSTVAYVVNAGGVSTAPNAADTVFGVYASAATGRSINAGGTVNTGGADYAEYMHKAPGAGKIAKGDIVAITTAGQVSDKLSEAVAYAVKSTDPSFVGGDRWAEHLPRPAEPTRPDVPFDPGDPEWQSADALYQAALAQHEQDVAAWAVEYESLRQTVDRIAFSGQVPVNVHGAQPGDYILPDAGGTPWNMHSDPEVPAWFKKYERAVGKVIAIEADGRARIVVKQPS